MHLNRLWVYRVLRMWVCFRGAGSELGELSGRPRGKASAVPKPNPFGFSMAMSERFLYITRWWIEYSKYFLHSLRSVHWSVHVIVGAALALTIIWAEFQGATWLILPVVICLSQRLSHACVSINDFILWNCEWLIKSVIVYLIVPLLLG